MKQKKKMTLVRVDELDADVLEIPYNGDDWYLLGPMLWSKVGANFKNSGRNFITPIQDSLLLLCTRYYFRDFDQWSPKYWRFSAK
jgi:hypothetical protein